MAKSISPEQFKQKCAALGGKIYQEDDRMVCDVTVNNHNLKFIQYPDGMVSFAMPKPMEDIIKQFYTK